jgi:uncharacterized protein (DUF1330 family)
MFIHGGMTLSQDGSEKYLNDLHMYKDGYWTKIVSTEKSSIFFKSSLMKPVKKFGHSFLFHEENIYFFGGTNKKSTEMIVEFVKENDVKTKPISAKTKIDLIYSKPEYDLFDQS